MTLIHLSAGTGRAHLTTRAGALVPRVITIGPAFARVAIVAGGALLLGGDSVRVSITVGAGCTLELEDIGGTVAYDADGHSSEWLVDVTVESNGLLVWHGLPFVVADGSNVERRTTITLHGDGALACLRETIVLGRTGERGGSIGLRTDVHVITAAGTHSQAHMGADRLNGADAEALFVEQLSLSGAEPIPGVVSRNRVLDSVLLLGTRAPSDAAASLAASRAAIPTAGLGSTEILELEGPGSIARSLQQEAHHSVLSPIWDDWCAHALSVHAAGVDQAASDTQALQNETQLHTRPDPTSLHPVRPQP